MRLARSAGLLFIHVPKTGGTTINHVLEDLVPDVEVHDQHKHQTFRRALADDPARADLFSFGFVRNPWARMVSWWSMIHRVQQKAADGDERAIYQLSGNPMWRLALQCGDFDEFVQVVPDRVKRVRRPQIDYLTTPDGRRVDFIGRTETFEADLTAVLGKLGVPPPEIPRWNESSYGYYRDYYTDRSRRRIGDLCRKDIDIFGYSF